MIQSLVGQIFNPYSSDLISLNDSVSVIRTPSKEYPNAISVMKGDLLLGHIAEKDNENHEVILNSCPMTATIESFTVHKTILTKFPKVNIGDVDRLTIALPQLEGERVDGHYLLDGKLYMSATTVVDTDFTGITKYAVSKATGSPMKFTCPYYKKYEDALDYDAMCGTLMHDLFECLFLYKKDAEGFAQQFNIWKTGYISHGKTISGNSLTEKQIQHIFYIAKSLNDKYEIDVIATEEQVKDEKNLIAGRFDMFARLRVGSAKKRVWKKILIDWKSSNKAHEAHKIQISWYAKMKKADEAWLILCYLQKLSSKGLPKQGYSIAKLSKKQIDIGYQKMVLLKQTKDLKF